MHISASVFINDDESGLHEDFERWLEELAPEKPHSQYAHNQGEDNADAHLKRTIMGREVVVAVTDGRLDFGPWERIFYGEFDGKRRKRVFSEGHWGVTPAARVTQHRQAERGRYNKFCIVSAMHITAGVVVNDNE